MRLTLMTDYALRLLMYVGQHTDRLCTIGEIAQAYGISEAHLMKVTHQLAQQGWLVTVRGKGGGLRLAHAPADIGLGKVVRGIEPDFDLVACFANDSCGLSPGCRLTGILQDALGHFLGHLDRFTLADILPAPAAFTLQAVLRVHPTAETTPAVPLRAAPH